MKLFLLFVAIITASIIEGSLTTIAAQIFIVFTIILFVFTSFFYSFPSRVS